jgi:hypothetical protein
MVFFLGACRMHDLSADPLSGTDAALAGPDLSADGQSPPVEAGVLTPDQQCVRTDLGAVPPPPAPCPAVPSDCAPPGISCRSTALAETLRAQLKACGTFCGEIAIAFSSGCASDVSFTPSGSLQREDVRACIRQLVLGKAWTCAPPNAWAAVYIDNCTLP